MHTRAQRRFNMSQIRGRDTKPELVLRRGLHSRGFRFRLHVSELPGSPDLVFPRHRVALFVHGCFWHGHECPTFRWPTTRRDFWQRKICNNAQRDAVAIAELRCKSWRVLTIWECATRGPGRLELDSLLDSCEGFLRDSSRNLWEVAGNHHDQFRQIGGNEIAG